MDLCYRPPVGETLFNTNYRERTTHISVIMCNFALSYDYLMNG